MLLCPVFYVLMKISVQVENSNLQSSIVRATTFSANNLFHQTHFSEAGLGTKLFLVGSTLLPKSQKIRSLRSIETEKLV